MKKKFNSENAKDQRKVAREYRMALPFVKYTQRVVFREPVKDEEGNTVTKDVDGKLVEVTELKVVEVQKERIMTYREALAYIREDPKSNFPSEEHLAAIDKNKPDTSDRRKINRSYRKIFNMTAHKAGVTTRI